MSLIDEALSANATIADGYDPGRGKPPAPRIATTLTAGPGSAPDGIARPEASCSVNLSRVTDS